MLEVAGLAGASESRNRAGQAHDREDLAPRAHPRVATGAWGVADYLHLEPKARPRVQDPDEDGQDDGEHEAKRQDEPVDRPTRPGGLVGERLPLGKDLRLEARRVA